METVTGTTPTVARRDHLGRMTGDVLLHGADNRAVGGSRDGANRAYASSGTGSGGGGPT